MPAFSERGWPLLCIKQIQRRGGFALCNSSIPPGGFSGSFCDPTALDCHPILVQMPSVRVVSTVMKIVAPRLTARIFLRGAPDRFSLQQSGSRLVPA